MAGPDRINFLSLFCSCVGHAAILGGILFGLSEHRREAVGATPSAPLMIKLIPLDRADGARGKRHDAAPAPAPPSGRGGAQAPEPVRAGPPTALVVAPPGDVATPVASGESEGGRGAASAADFSEYQRRLYEALARSSRYPAEARRQHLAGVTRLAFRLDQQGAVLDSWVQESSGSELLDNAALEALDRAQPLPPIPAGLPPRLDFVIEIDLSVMQQRAVRAAGQE